MIVVLTRCALVFVLTVAGISCYGSGQTPPPRQSAHPTIAQQNPQCPSDAEMVYIVRIELARENWQSTLNTIVRLNDQFLADNSVYYTERWNRDYVSALAILGSAAQQLAEIPEPPSDRSIAVHQKQLSERLTNFALLQEIGLLDARPEVLRRAISELKSVYATDDVLTAAIRNLCQ